MGRRTLAVVLACCAIGLTGCLSAAACKEDVLQELPSPDGAKRAVVFVSNCGATTGFSTQVTVVAPNQDLADGGHAFIADDDHGRAPTGPHGGPIVAVRWMSAHALEVRHHPLARLFAPMHPPEGVEVRLLADSTVGAASGARP